MIEAFQAERPLATENTSIGSFRHAAASRRCFEAALSLEPDNMAAQQLEVRLEASHTELSGSLDRSLSALEETRATLRAGQEDTDKALSAADY